MRFSGVYRKLDINKALAKYQPNTNYAENSEGFSF